MIEKRDIPFILGGAVIGAAIGYILSKIGFKKILYVLRDNNIISENVANAIDEFGKDISPD